MGLIRREAVGKTYGPTRYEVTRDNIAAYARSYGDERAAYEQTAPLLFAVVYSFEASIAPLFDPELSTDPVRMVRRLVRGSLDVESLRPVGPGDVVTTMARVEGVEEKRSGELLEIDTISKNERGEEVAVVKNYHFIRGDSKAATGEPKPEKAEPEPINIDWESTIQIPDNLPAAYAEASLDRNPIHTDPAFAKSVGFPGVIVQGSATMAIAQRAIIDAVCGGDPTRLLRLSCRFAKPVFPGDTLTIRGSRLGTFETLNQEGKRVLEEGAFEALGMNL